MKTDIQKSENSTVTVNITVDSEKVGKVYGMVVANAVRFTTVPGFRKGKAPKKLAEKNLNMDMVRQHALEDLISETLNDAFKENDIKPVANPDIEVISFDPEGELAYKAVVEVLPEINIGEYDNFEIEVEKPELKEENVEKALENLREQYASFEEIEEERGIQKGDFVIVDFEGSENGKKIDKASASNYQMEVKEDSFIPGFVENIIGLKKGEEKEFSVTFPEDYHASMKGKTVTFKFTLHRIEAKKLSELDDEFAKKASDFQTIEELRSNIRERMQKNIDSRANSLAQEKISKKLSELVNIDLPGSMILAEQQKLLDRMSYQYAQYGVDIFKNLTDEQIMQFAEDKRPEAIERVKTDLALEEVVKKENITIDENELEEKMRQIALGTGQDFRKFKSGLVKTGRINGLREVLKKEKALEYVLSLTAVTYVEPAVEEKTEEKTEG